jgi:histidinol-phosphate/aromatic aminotransferase/cobyric acid decarboxylase-like protein
VIGLPGQVAGVLALRSRDYYRERYAETHALRVRLQQSLEALGLEVFPGTANFLYCRCRGENPDIPRLLSACRREGLFLRDTSTMSRKPDGRSFRVAVKDVPTSARMVEILERALYGPLDSGRSA